MESGNLWLHIRHRTFNRIQELRFHRRRSALHFIFLLYSLSDSRPVRVPRESRFVDPRRARNKEDPSLWSAVSEVEPHHRIPKNKRRRRRCPPFTLELLITLHRTLSFDRSRDCIETRHEQKWTVDSTVHRCLQHCSPGTEHRFVDKVQFTGNQSIVKGPEHTQSKSPLQIKSIIVDEARG